MFWKATAIFIKHDAIVGPGIIWHFCDLYSQWTVCIYLLYTIWQSTVLLNSTISKNDISTFLVNIFLLGSILVP